MNKKKSLGSSPIGYSSLGSTSYHFIRDLGRSNKDDTQTGVAAASNGGGSYSGLGGDDQAEKKIVSYYLEIELIKRLKLLADEQGTYYSSVVSEALEAWVEGHGY